MAKKFRTKSFAKSKLLKMRGGFQPAMPRRPVAPSLPKDMKGFADKAANGNPSRARRFLDEISSSNFNISFNPRISVKLGAQSGDGTIGSKTRTTIEEEQSISRIMGDNGVTKGRRHTWNGKAGQPPSKWICETEKLLGSTVATIRDTQIDYPFVDSTRPLFTRYAGFNQKSQHLLSSVLFGFQASELRNWLNIQLEAVSEPTKWKQSSTKDQVGYAGIKNLQSHLTIVNRNAFLPVKLKVSLLAVDVRADNIDLMQESTNSSILTQDQNTMPVYLQQKTPSYDSAMATVSVDPLSKGIKGSNAFRELAKIVTSKTFKLSSGDELVIKYKHELGSGLNMNKMSELISEAGSTGTTATNCMISYMLLVEQYGVSCECYKNDNPSAVMTGTSSSGIHFEGRKKLEYALSSHSVYTAVNQSADSSWFSDTIALKYFTKKILNSSVRRANVSPADIGDAPDQYTIPLVTDSSVTQSQSL
jgi:hypothetical protein